MLDLFDTRSVRYTVLVKYNEGNRKQMSAEDNTNRAKTYFHYGPQQTFSIYWYGLCKTA